MEEQEMEAEALAAIFDTAFEITSAEQPFQWSVSLYPEDTYDEAERDELNNVACRLKVDVPCEYPDVLPVMDVEVIKVRFITRSVGCHLYALKLKLDSSLIIMTH